jgi:hypothetical protein
MDNTTDNNSNTNNNDVPPPPLIHIPPTNTLNAIRSTYMNLFNQILDNSFNINCICKTTFKSNASLSSSSSSAAATASSHTTKKCNIFDKGHNDFMSDDDDDEEFMNDKNENDIEMQGNILNEESSRRRRHPERDMILLDLDYAEESPSNEFTVNNTNTNNNKKMSKICDLSCFEHMRYVHSTLKNCLSPSLSNTNTKSNLDKFEVIWESLKFLKKNPKSCDYYGSTLFHYAAADDQCELLKCLVEKDSTGVFSVDSKGKRFEFTQIIITNFAVFFLIYNP